MLKSLCRSMVFIVSGILSVCLCCSVDAGAAKRQKTTTVTISAAGDCTLGVDTRWYHTFDSVYASNGPAYFLERVRPVFLKDDLTVVNFEGTLTTYGVRADKTFTFKGPPGYVSILENGSVEVVDLANNHSMDYGMPGFADTKRTLRDKKIAYFYKDEKIAYKKVRGVKTAFIGFDKLSGVSKRDIRRTVKEAKKARASIIIVSFHWGTEGSYHFDADQRALARYAIDRGASLVLGHHPHVLQGLERYKGRYIVYSLGNFCFGGNTDPPDKDTMIYQQTFYVKNKRLLPRDNAKIIPCSLSSHSTYNDYQPQVLSGAEKRRLIAKIQSLGGVRIKTNGKLG